MCLKWPKIFLVFHREDLSFVAHHIPTGSYIVEVANRDFLFDPVRVDVSSRGKARSRKLNLVQPSLVVNAPYPVKLVYGGYCSLWFLEFFKIVNRF